MTVSDALRTRGVEAQPSGSFDDLGWRRRRRATLVWVLALSAALIASAVVGISVGSVSVSPGTVWRIVGHHTLGWPDGVAWTRAEDNITWLVRVPRVLLAVLVGAGLATTGVALQALVRNLLAEPYLIGVSSGASMGAAVVILFGGGVGAGYVGLSLSAFLGGLAATGIVFLTATIGGRITPVRLVLAGITVAYALSAVTSFLIFAGDARDGARAVLFWLLGSLAQARWSALAIPAVVVAVGVAMLLLWSRRLDALTIGDETALALGVSPTRFRAQAFALVAVCVGAVVAVSGPIGFVGLVIPHFARRLVGGEHRRVLPVAALLGAAFLLWADVIARVAFQPREMPLGVVTALIGAPFLLVLVRRFHGADPALSPRAPFRRRRRVTPLPAKARP